MKEVRARLDIEVFVDCPHCDFMIDLRNEADTDGRCHDDCGDILRQACPSEGHWSVEHENFSADEVRCSNCKGEFNVKGMDW